MNIFEEGGPEGGWLHLDPRGIAINARGIRFLFRCCIGSADLSSRGHPPDANLEKCHQKVGFLEHAHSKLMGGVGKRETSIREEVLFRFCSSIGSSWHTLQGKLFLVRSAHSVQLYNQNRFRWLVNFVSSLIVGTHCRATAFVCFTCFSSAVHMSSIDFTSIVFSSY